MSDTSTPTPQPSPTVRALLERLDRMQAQINEQQAKIAELEQRLIGLQQPLTARIGGGIGGGLVLG